MERRDDLRAAIHKLLSGSNVENSPGRPSPEAVHKGHLGQSAAYTDSQLVTLRSVQASLQAHQIEADIAEIVHALLESLATRPDLCRGLVAAYLLGA